MIIHEQITAKEIKSMHKKIHRILKTNDKIRGYFEISDFDGWTLEGFWENLKKDGVQATDYEKIAMVGNKKWESWLSLLIEPVTTAEVNYFSLENKEKAKEWIEK